jgi:hypothetical protein
MSRSRKIPQLVIRAHDPRRARLVVLGLSALALAAVAVAWLLGAHGAAPDLSDIRTRLSSAETELTQARIELKDTQQKLAVYERSDQVSRTANDSLQQTLSEREEEIAALRADLAFYQRLVGGGRGPRQGLNVHALTLKRIGDSGGFGYTLTLTQNLKKAAVTQGTAQLSVEGVQGQSLRTLSWRDLVQDAEATPLNFGFKYFQQLDGSLMLPSGFTPNRVRVVVKSNGGEQTEQAFAWSEALAAGENDHVPQ